MKQPVALVILDGWGVSPSSRGNAIAAAKTPNLDRIRREFSYTTLQASGKHVGLLPHQDGNSEAGHLNIGAGRIVEQTIVRINYAIEDGTFMKNAAFHEAIKHAQKHKSRIHIMGMLGNEMSAHAYPDHLYALLKLMHEKNISPVYLHLFTDGRDSPPHDAIRFLKKLRGHMREGQGIATLMGRFYGMERNKRWEITGKAYHVLLGYDRRKSSSAEEAVLQAYNRGETDEFIEPTVIDQFGCIQDEDAVIFFNLRSDRARQLSKALVQKKFNNQNPGAFRRRKVLKDLELISMTDFGPDLDHILTAFPEQDLNDTLPMVLRGRRQLYIAESEKYAHITFFLNGGYADPLVGEERMKVPSPASAFYDKHPEMSAKKITDIVVANIRSQAFDFYAINFANADMIGHTGNMKAAIKACECIDAQIGILMKEILRRDGFMMITADHGNAEEMLNLKTGEMDTEHSTSLVPFFLTKKGVKLKKGVLGNVLPTLLHFLEIPALKVMLDPLCKR